MDPSIQFTDAKPLSASEIENQNQANDGGWNCPRCDAHNPPGGQFCHKCGFNKSQLVSNLDSDPAETEKPPKKSHGGAIIAISMVLILLAVGSAGAYLYFGKKQKDEAKNYLKFEGNAFGNSVNFINGLSTEKELENSDDNNDLFLKKLEDEKNKSDQVLADIRVTRTKNSQAKSNQLVVSTDSTLKEYYDSAEKVLLAYNEYLTYETETLRIAIKMDQEEKKIETVFKNANTPADASKAIKSMAKTLDDANAQMKKLIPPPGFEESHKKGIETVDKMNGIFRDITSAIDAKDEQKLILSLTTLDDFIKNDKSNKEISQMEKYQFDQLHQKFVDLRQKADEIKGELIKENAVYNFDLKNISIEGW